MYSFSIQLTDIGQPGKTGANVVKHVEMVPSLVKEHAPSHHPVTKDKLAPATVKKFALAATLFVKVIDAVFIDIMVFFERKGWSML